MRELLRAWEQGWDQPPPSRALLLLAASRSEVDAGALLGLTPGECDARLLELREQWFGHRLEALADCPGCGRTVEAEIDLRDLRQDAGRPLGTDLGVRLPTCADLIAVAGAPDLEAGRRQLLERCLDGDHAPTDELAAAASARMAEADPQATLEIELRCPDCGRSWSLPFEIGTILWQEVSAWARGLLQDVHALATAYGWSESDILALSPGRRRLYLELVAG